MGTPNADNPLTCSIVDGELRISIGVNNVLAEAENSPIGPDGILLDITDPSAFLGQIETYFKDSVDHLACELSNLIMFALMDAYNDGKGNTVKLSHRTFDE